MYTHTRMHARTDTHMYTHTHIVVDLINVGFTEVVPTNTHTCIHTHVYTHTHDCLYVLLLQSFVRCVSFTHCVLSSAFLLLLWGWSFLFFCFFGGGILYTILFQLGFILRGNPGSLWLQYAILSPLMPRGSDSRQTPRLFRKTSGFF